MKMLSYSFVVSLTLTAVAFANPTVNSPASGAYVGSPFTLSASSATCSYQPVAAMAYSIDSGSDVVTVNSQVLDAQVSSATGVHVLHVKAWGNQGAGCVTDVSIDVTVGTSGGNPIVSTPSAGATVSSPFPLSASATSCSSQPVGAMAYSIDSGANLVTVNAQSLNAQVSATVGAHTLHVKSWGDQGAGCATSIAVNVASVIPAGGNPAVSSPANGATVSAPFTLAANSATCSSQPVGAMAYSIDSGSDVITVNSQALNTQVSAGAGAHTLHVKSWGNQGAGCSADIAVTVATSGSGSTAGSGSAAISISSPLNGATVNSSFTLSATASTCSSQPVGAMAYSIDNGADIVTVNAQSLDAQAVAGAGSHTVHVKSWGTKGAGCLANVAVTVAGTVSAQTGPYIPSNAISVSNIQTMSNWLFNNDPASGGSSNGSMNLVSSPAYSGTTLQTVTNYKNSGGEIYHVTFGDDTVSQNFVYDVWVYLANTTNTLANLEMDMNQVIANGQTIIYGFQCDGYSKTWDYTINAGSPSAPNDTWIHSKQTCDTRTWSQNKWHHIQIAYSRNSSGAVTYQSVYLDGVESPINATVPSAFALGWGPTLLANFQVDGLGSGGQVTVDVDNMTVYRW